MNGAVSRYSGYAFWLHARLTATVVLLHAFFGPPVLAACLRYQVFADYLMRSRRWCLTTRATST